LQWRTKNVWEANPRKNYRQGPQTKVEKPQNGRTTGTVKEGSEGLKGTEKEEQWLGRMGPRASTGFSQKANFKKKTGPKQKNEKKGGAGGALRGELGARGWQGSVQPTQLGG